MFQLVLTLWWVPNVELTNPLFHEVQSCWNVSLKSVPLSIWEECAEGQNVLHCLPDNNDILGLVCYPIQWIVKGFCPYYNTYLGNMDQKKCGGTDCPEKDFKSADSLKFSGCYPKEQQTTTPATTLPRATSTSPSKTTGYKTDMMDSTLSTNNSSVCQNRFNSDHKGDVVGVAVPLIIFIGILAVLLIYVIVKVNSVPFSQNKSLWEVLSPTACCKTEKNPGSQEDKQHDKSTNS